MKIAISTEAPPRINFMNAPGDLDWLFETHLKSIAAERGQYKSFILYGNEDCPSRIDLYARKMPNYDAAPEKTLTRGGESNELA